MGRLRARLSKSAVDQQIQRHVASAQRAVAAALSTCRRARDVGGVEGRRARRVARDLARAQSALGNIGRVTPGYELDDPDLMPEDERSRQWHKEREAEAKVVDEALEDLGFGFEDADDVSEGGS